MQLDAASFVGWAYHSTDSGKTWSLEKLPNVYFSNIDCTPDTKYCAAVGINVLQNSAFMSRSN
jgi:hypothetical protein